MAKATAKQAAEMGRWMVSFAEICKKLNEGAHTPGSDIRLDSQECRDLITGLQTLSRKEDQDG